MTFLLEEKVKTHDTYTKIEKVIGILETIIESDIPAETVPILERLSETINVFKEALDRVDPWFLSQSTLQNMNGPISNIISQLNSYKNNKNVQHLKSAINYLDGLIPFLSQLMVTRTPEDIEGVRESVISFRKSIGQHLGNVEKQSNATREALETNIEKLNDLTVTIESQKNRIDSVISDFQEQFFKSQTERNEKTEQFIKLTTSELNDLISISGKNFDKQINQQREEFISQMNNNEIEFDGLMVQQEKRFIEELKSIKKMNEEAEKIVGIISMKGLAHGYQKIANDEGRKAFWWNMGSIASILSVIAFGVFFILLHEGSMEWTTLISRVVLSGFGLTLFTYCAKQSGNFRSEERRNRKIELELASLDPYLKDLEDEQQKEIKQNLVNKYFGVEFLNGKEQSKEKRIDAIMNNTHLIHALAEKVSQIKKK